MIIKDNISNKSAENGQEKFSFPVLSLLWAINRESGALSAARADHSIKAGRRRSSFEPNCILMVVHADQRRASVRTPHILPVAPIGQTAETRAMPG
jgi:hypothetical protein